MSGSYGGGAAGGSRSYTRTSYSNKDSERLQVSKASCDLVVLYCPKVMLEGGRGTLHCGLPF